MQYEKLFRTQSAWKSIFSLAVPSVIIILVMILYNMTDMFFIGQLGDYNQVAAVSVVSPLFSVSAAVATMLGSGGKDYHVDCHVVDGNLHGDTATAGI